MNLGLPVESLPPESKNLESLRWYLGDLRERATANEFPNAEEFAKATQIAEQTLTELIKALKNK